MVQRRNHFDDQSVARIARVVRQVEGTPISTPGASPGRSLSSDPELWQECKNAAGETIPGHSVVSIDTTVPTMDDRQVGNAIKPSTTWCNLHAFTQDRDAELISSVGKVSVTMETALVKYDTGTPAPGEGWGIKPGQYTLSKGYPGARCIRVVDSTKKIMLAQFLPLTTLLGQTTNAVAANTPTTDYIILAGTAGSESDAGFVTVPSAVCAIPLDTATKIELVFVNNQWQMIPAVNGTPGSTRLVKTTTTHASNATATVNVWVGTPGSEVVSTGPITLSATNKSTSSIASGTFCLATLTNVADAGDPEDLKWYIIPLNGGGGGCRLFKGNLSGSLASGDSTVGLSSVIAYDNGSTPGTLTANNVFGLAAPNSSPAIVILRVSDGSYDLINVLHVVRPVVTDIAFTGTALTADFKSLVTMDDNDDTDDAEVFTVVDQSVVIDVFLDGLDLKETKKTLTVFFAGSGMDSTIVEGDTCPEE